MKAEVEKGRVVAGPFASSPEDGFNGAFELFLPRSREFVRVIASDGCGWQHVSVTRRDRHSVPTWQMMCEVKDLFWDDEDWVVQFHPAKSEYVDNHPGCLHLWRSTDKQMPTPPSILVGVKL